MGAGGFEPPKALLTDLQSAPFGHLGTPPRYSVKYPVTNQVIANYPVNVQFNIW